MLSARLFAAGRDPAPRLGSDVKMINSDSLDEFATIRPFEMNSMNKENLNRVRSNFIDFMSWAGVG